MAILQRPSRLSQYLEQLDRGIASPDLIANHGRARLGDEEDRVGNASERLARGLDDVLVLLGEVEEEDEGVGRREDGGAARMLAERLEGEKGLRCVWPRTGG